MIVDGVSPPPSGDLPPARPSGDIFWATAPMMQYPEAAPVPLRWQKLLGGLTQAMAAGFTIKS